MKAMPVKLFVARSQLLTAIKLFFENDDSYSVHTLAGAAQEIIERMCVAASIEPFLAHIQATYPGKTKGEIIKIIRYYRNCFKHADRDDEREILEFSDELNDFMIYIAVEDYLRLREASPIPFQVFATWFGAVHADRLAPAVDKSLYDIPFPGIRSLDRQKQKIQGQKALLQYLEDEVLRQDPKTEPL